MRKAQAAMEFLMTYGWAILIVLVVVAALFFLGVLNPKTGNNCIPVAPFASCDLKASSIAGSQEIVLKFPGDAAKDVKLSAMKINDNDCGMLNTGISSGTKTTFICAVSPGAKGDKYSGTVDVTYTSIGGLTHTTQLVVSGLIE
jgi:hypothetical protein